MGKEKSTLSPEVKLIWSSPNSTLISFMEYNAETEKIIKKIQKIDVAMPIIRIGIFMIAPFPVFLGSFKK
jgi:hypothetical protein